MSIPERHFFSHIDRQHSAGLEFSIQPELVKQGTDQLSPEPGHPMVLASRCSVQTTWQEGHAPTS